MKNNKIPLEKLIQNYVECQRGQLSTETAVYILGCVMQDDIERIKRGEPPAVRIYPRQKDAILNQLKNN